MIINKFYILFNFFFSLFSYFTTKGQRIGPYLLIDPIGSGSYGTVWRAINVQLHGEPDQIPNPNDRLSNKYVAIKVVSKVEHMSIESRTRLAREASIMKSLDHPLMADLFYFKEDESNSYLVMEYLENSSLLDLINRTLEEWDCEEDEEENINEKECCSKCEYLNDDTNGQSMINTGTDIQKKTKHTKRVFKINLIDEEVVRKIFVQIIVALEFLHNVQHVAHRDIKAENVLLDRYNNIRIIDFGLSAIVQDETESMKRTVGSVAYTAPEILMKKRYSKSADIWSAGVLLYALSTSRLPFINQPNSNIISSSKNSIQSINSKNGTYSRNEINFLSRSQNPSSFYETYNDPKKMCQMILHGKLYIPESLSPELQDLLRRMLERDPKKRITIKEIEEHPFFSQSQYNMLIDFVKRQDKIEDIDLKLDPEIVAEMEARGMNCDLLPQFLFVQELDEVSAAYKEMKKFKVMKNLSKLYDKLENRSDNDQNQSQIPTQDENNEDKQISNQINLQNDLINNSSELQNNNELFLNKTDEQISQHSSPFFFCGNKLHKIIHDDYYEDSSESNQEHDCVDGVGEQRKFRKSQSVVISELNLNVLLNSSEESSVQTSPPFNDNIKKLNHKVYAIPHPSTPPQQVPPQAKLQQNAIHSQMVRSQTSSLIFTPNESSDGTNTKIVPKSYIRPRIHLGLMNT